jgi:hypothetical protein
MTLMNYSISEDFTRAEESQGRPIDLSVSFSPLSLWLRVGLAIERVVSPVALGIL